MVSLLRFLLVLAGLLPLLATADESLSWRCWYDQQVHVTCLIDNVPDGGTGIAGSALPANIPAIVRVLRQDPGAFKNRIVHIPLHTQPYDMEFTAQLARSVVCGTRPQCMVNFSPTLPPAEEVVALLTKHLDSLAGNPVGPLALEDD